jgi:hypothetical protein
MRFFTTYKLSYNRIDDLPKKKRLIMLLLDFGMLMVMEFSTLNLFIALAILGSTSNWIHMLDNKKSIIQQYRCNQSL